MNRERFDYLCRQAESGHDTYVSHGSSNQEGRVESCSMGHLIVETNDGNRRCWDFSECAEIDKSG
ncbi:MAG: hypothetical protein R2940_06215 [Syntrophotaleaceae bacterium]